MNGILLPIAVRLLRAARLVLLAALVVAPCPGLTADLRILPAATVSEEGITLPWLGWPDGWPKQTWTLLACAAGECQLHPVRLSTAVLDPNRTLSVRAELVKGRLGKGWESIMLVQGELQPVGSTALMLSRFTPRTPRRAEDAALGTTGVFIAGVGVAPFDVYRVLPRAPNDIAEPAVVRVFVETAAQRQAIHAIPLQRFARGSKTRDFLRFAGDLDGDGRLDFVTYSSRDDMSYRTVEDARLRLWLSSRARAGELVGLAAETSRWLGSE
jgi:hypothetical protein